MKFDFKQNIPFIIALVVITLLFLIVEYSLISKDFFALSADESGHTLEAFEWLNGDGQVYSIWLPFFKIINAAALKIHYDIFVTPRVLSSIFGLFTCFALMFLSYQLFENKITAIFTGFFAAIFLPIAVFSVLPLTEIYFFFFIVSSLGFLFLWFRKEKNIFLWITVICIILSTTVRYEAWIFAFFIYSIMVYHIYSSEKTYSHKLTTAVLIALIMSLFPLYWLHLSSVSNSSPQGFITSVTSRYHEGGTIAEIKNNAFYLFLILNITSLNIIGLAPLFFLSRLNITAKKYSIILFGTLITFSTLSFFMKAMPTHNYWRIAMIWCLLLLPFTAFWLSQLLEDWKSNPLNKYVFFIFFILLIYFFNQQINKFSAQSYFTKDDVAAGEYLSEKLVKLSNKIYFIPDKRDKWRFANILVASQNPEKIVMDFKELHYLNSDSVMIDSEFLTHLKKNQISYVIIPSQLVPVDSSNSICLNKEFESWKIFEYNSAEK